MALPPFFRKCCTIISPGGAKGAKKENKNGTKIVTHFSPSWPPFSFFVGPVDLCVWNPGQNTVFLVIVMVVLSQFLLKTRIVGHLDFFRDFEPPPFFRGQMVPGGQGIGGVADYYHLIIIYWGGVWIGSGQLHYYYHLIIIIYWVPDSWSVNLA